MAIKHFFIECHSVFRTAFAVITLFFIECHSFHRVSVFFIESNSFFIEQIIFHRAIYQPLNSKSARYARSVFFRNPQAMLDLKKVFSNPKSAAILDLKKSFSKSAVIIKNHLPLWFSVMINDRLPLRFQPVYFHRAVIEMSQQKNNFHRDFHRAVIELSQ